MIGSAISGAISGLYQGLKRHIESPSYFYCTSSPYVTYVTFNDDIAHGMKAFIEHEGNKVEMPLAGEIAESCRFYIPNEALKAREFTVQAIDRDGNMSKPKKLYTLDGYSA